MSDSVKTEKKYPSNPEDIESEKEIVEELKKLKPASLMLKGFAINHSLLQLKEIEANEQNEIAQKDAVVNKQFQSNLKHINDLVNGTRHPNENELKNLASYFTEEELAKKDELFSQIKPIEGYWLTALKNHGLFKEIITENDAKALKALNKVEFEMSEDAAHPFNFKLHFHFAANEYFTNEVLSIHLHVKEPREVDKIDGTEISWKEGKNITKKTVQKKQKNKKTGQTRTVTKEEDCDSLFKLFNNCEQHDHEEHEHDDDEEADHEHDIYDHTEWAYSFFEEIIPYSLEYFLGVRKEFGGPGDEDDEDFEDDEDDGSDDDAPKKIKGGKAPKGKQPTAKPAGGEQQKDCKQQ
jgi:nucleosome assembly protein 1-like 1